MKNLITFVFMGWALTGLMGQTRVSVLSALATETTLRLDLGSIQQTPVSTPQGEAKIISFEKGTPLLMAGTPDLTKFATLLQIPNSGKMEVEILHADFEDYANVLIAPSKGNLLRNVDPADLPFKYGTRYQQDDFFPGQLADLQPTFVLRDLRGQALWIYPVQYNPVRKVLRVYSNITVRVYQTSDSGENEIRPNPKANLSPAFKALYQKLFLNFEAHTLPESRGDAEPEQLLIIAKDAFLPNLEPYVAWKRQMGIHTTVVPISEVGTDPEALYDYVKTYYSEHQITYLLLVGDENALRPLVRPGSIYSCDNCLGYMEGNDHFPEILVGRFHAATEEELNIMMHRNLDYEKTPLADSTLNWCATGMASTSNQGAGFGDDNQADYEQGNEWKSKLLADGFEKYWEFYDGDQAAISPTPGDETADQAGDPVNTQLIQLMNSRGISLYNYTGHGWEQGLASGNFNTDAVQTLRNNHRYPIVIAVACCAGNFTNNGGGDCLGEAMQRAGNLSTGEPWGGIAGFYSSDFQSWSPPMEGQDGMNQYLVDADGIQLDPNLGAMAAYGNARMIAAYGQGGIDMADVWNPFLDPTTIPRTALPKTLVASHEHTLLIGTNTLLVSCDVEGALVSLYWQGQTLAVASVEGGIATLDFPALDNVGELVVTATQFNYRPYQGSIQVVPGAGAFVINQAITLDDSAGNHNQKADYGETIALNLSLSNIGDQLANATSATLQTNDLNVTITDNSELFGDLVAGTTLEKLAAFEFTVNDDVVNGHIVPFKLHLDFNNGQSYEANLPVQLLAPKLEAGILSISDLIGGDGDGRMESGETAVFTVKNFNLGKSKSPDAIGDLSSNSPWVSINGPISLGPLDANTGTADATFEVTIASNTPESSPVSFDYQVLAGNYAAAKTYGTYTINPIVETFETQTFDQFPWVFSGNKPWFITDNSAYTGAYSSRSGLIADEEQSVMDLSLNFTTDGTVTFARRVSSEQDYDFLRFLIDDIQRAAWSGEIPWEEVSFPITSGVHKLSWIYQKDQIVSANEDIVWVDDITVPPHQLLVGTSHPAQADFNANIAPNPTSGKAILQGLFSNGQPIEIALLDCFGHKLQQFPSVVGVQQGAFVVSLDLLPYPSGLYFVKLQSSKGIQVLKLLKS